MATTSARGRRAAAELAPADVIVAALEIRHPALADPIGVVQDTEPLTLGTLSCIPLAFRVRLAPDVDGRAPSAELALDNVGRELMRWVDAAQGGAGATMRVMQVLRTAEPPRIEWEVTTDVLAVRATQREVVVQLGYDPLLTRPAVLLRYEPHTAPGLF